jgi:hypothetical protein
MMYCIDDVEILRWALDAKMRWDAIILASSVRAHLEAKRAKALLSARDCGCLLDGEGRRMEDI